jgi:hypothetical protein
MRFKLHCCVLSFILFKLYFTKLLCNVLCFAELQIRSDVNLALDTTLENIQVKSRDMAQHFDRIDRLEVNSLVFGEVLIQI